jgi:hypothetical protein
MKSNHDGYRCQVLVERGEARVFTRNGGAALAKAAQPRGRSFPGFLQSAITL